MSTDPQISTFPKVTDPACGKTITISQFVGAIRSPRPEIIDKVRQAQECLAAGRKADFDKLKRTLPAVTMSGTFSKRDSESLEEHSGVLTVDIDKLPEGQVQEVIGKLVSDPHVILAFLSPSGKGVKAAIRAPIAGDGTGHLEAFKAAERYFKDVHGLTLDQSGKDVSRLCFVSHDPDAHLNLDAVPLDVANWQPLTDEEAMMARRQEMVGAALFKGLASPPPEEPPVLTNDRGDVIGERGNLVVIQGQMKSGKTGVVSGIMASFISDPDSGSDCLGFVAPPADGFVLHFDCEQGPKNHFRLMQTTVQKRAGLAEVPGDLASFTLLAVPLAERWALVETAAETVAKESKIRCVIFDGGADFLATLNDEAMANELVDRQFRFAIQHDCLVVIVLHENPGTEYGKTRGHYGSQLHRKMQGALVVTKGKDEISSVYGAPLRDGYWPQSEAHNFKYDTAQGMHVTCGDPTAERARIKEAGKKASLQDLASKVLTTPANYTDLLARIASEEGCSSDTARNRYRDMKGLGIISKNDDGTYQQGVRG